MKSKFIKTLALILALSLTVVLASCGETEPANTDISDNKDSVVTDEKINSEDKSEVKEPDKKEDKKEQLKEEDKNKEDKPESKPDKKDEKPETPAPTTPPAQPTQPEAPQQPEVSGTPKEETPSSPPAPSLETASAYIGKSASSLAAAIGQPSGGKTYVTSCMGEGDDGEWYYPGFTVYTYRAPDGSEKVIDVLGG